MVEFAHLMEIVRTKELGWEPYVITVLLWTNPFGSFIYFDDEVANNGEDLGNNVVPRLIFREISS